LHAWDSTLIEEPLYRLVVHIPLYWNGGRLGIIPTMSDRRRLFDEWTFDYDASKGSDDAYPFAGCDRPE